MGSLSSPNAETVRSWANAEEAALAAVRAKICELRAEETALVVRLRALHDMLGTFSAAAETALAEAATAASHEEQVSAKQPDDHAYKIAGGRRGSVGFRIRTQVAEILAERREPMHINDIWAEFGQRGWEIPGRGSPANITAHLTGSVEIVSATRGYYVLETPSAASSGKTATATVRTSNARKTSAKFSRGNR